MITTTKQDRDFIESMIPSGLLEDAIGYIKSNFSPSDIFDTTELSEWALENGYTKKEDE